jgi:hypothetical protein
VFSADHAGGPTSDDDRRPPPGATTNERPGGPTDDHTADRAESDRWAVIEVGDHCRRYIEGSGLGERPGIE